MHPQLLCRESQRLSSFAHEREKIHQDVLPSPVVKPTLLLFKVPP